MHEALIWFGFLLQNLLQHRIPPLQYAMISMFAKRYMAMSMGNVHPRVAEVA